MDNQNVVDSNHGVLFSLKNERHFDTWMTLKDVTLNERSQTQNDRCYMIPLE